MTKTTVFTLQE